jgi:hypothetical protein
MYKSYMKQRKEDGYRSPNSLCAMMTGNIGNL